MPFDVARTPEERFAKLEGYDFEPRYVDVPVEPGSKQTLRLHYVEAGPNAAAATSTVLCMHGQPTWSYLYRKMVPPLVAAGHRVLCPDFIGFGRSDKPVSQDAYTYRAHVAWMSAFLQAVDARHVTLVCQDWGGLIGLRLVADFPDRFDRVVTANTGLPEGPMPALLTAPIRRGYAALPVPDKEKVVEMLGKGMSMPGAWLLFKMGILRMAPSPDEIFPFFFWIKHCQYHPDFTPQSCVEMAFDGDYKPSAAVMRGYAAPHPEGADSERYKAGARRFPSLVPLFKDGGVLGARQDVEDNTRAWGVFERWTKPWLTAFSDSDPVTAGGHKVFWDRVPGTQGVRHVVIRGAGHFLQEERPVELAQAVNDFIAGKLALQPGQRLPPLHLPPNAQSPRL